MFKKISLYFTALVLVLSTVGSAYAVTLKASHQWPGTPRADGSFDPRHEMVQIIADEVKKANVDIDIRIYPAKSLYKPNVLILLSLNTCFNAGPTILSVLKSKAPFSIKDEIVFFTQ